MQRFMIVLSPKNLSIPAREPITLSLDPPAEFGRWLGGISGRLI